MHEQPTFKQPIPEEPWVGVLGERGPAANDHILSQLNAQYDQAPQKVLDFLSDPLVTIVDPAESPRAHDPFAELPPERELSEEDKTIVALIRGSIDAVTERTSNGRLILLSFDEGTYEARRFDAHFTRQLTSFQELSADSSRKEPARRGIALDGLRFYFERRSAWQAQQSEQADASPTGLPPLAPVIDIAEVSEELPLDEVRRDVA